MKQAKNFANIWTRKEGEMGDAELTKSKRSRGLESKILKVEKVSSKEQKLAAKTESFSLLLIWTL